MTFTKTLLLSTALLLSTSSIAEVNSSNSGCYTGVTERRPIIINEISGGGEAPPPGLSKETFHQVLDRVAEVYQPIFKEMGLSLVVHKLWEEDVVNAAAYESPGNKSEKNIAMFGGMARHEAITADGYTLVACHEIGHHIGGAPNMFLTFSNEGQSDYFASLKCARKIFAKDDNIALMSTQEIPPIVQSKCRASFSDNEEYAICLRSAMAAKALGNLSRALNLKRNPTIPEPFHTTPDENEVIMTSHGHPQPQCRLDTYFAGALCPVSHTVNVSDEDAETGTCVRRTGSLDGVRPLCWYKPSSSPAPSAEMHLSFAR